MPSRLYAPDYSIKVLLDRPESPVPEAIASADLDLAALAARVRRLGGDLAERENGEPWLRCACGAELDLDEEAFLFCARCGRTEPHP